MVDFYKDEVGDFLTTSTEPEKLQRLATISNGDYWHLGKEKLGRRFVEKMLSELDQSGLSTVAEKQPYALSPWLLLAACTVFLVVIAGG